MRYRFTGDVSDVFPYLVTEVEPGVFAPLGSDLWPLEPGQEIDLVDGVTDGRFEPVDDEAVAHVQANTPAEPVDPPAGDPAPVEEPPAPPGDEGAPADGVVSVPTDTAPADVTAAPAAVVGDVVPPPAVVGDVVPVTPAQEG